MTVDKAPDRRPVRVAIDALEIVFDAVVDAEAWNRDAPVYLTRDQVEALGARCRKVGGDTVVELNWGICVLTSGVGTESETPTVILPTPDGLYPIAGVWPWRHIVRRRRSARPIHSPRPSSDVAAIA